MNALLVNWIGFSSVAYRSNAQDEAGAVGDVFRLADGLPSAAKASTQKDCLLYLDAVIEDEWKTMEHGKMSDKAQSLICDLWQDGLQYDPQTQRQSNIHQLMVDAISKTGLCRRNRSAQLHYGLHLPLWLIVIFGGASTIAFTYFFAVNNVTLQILMTSVITMIICFNIYMLAGFDAPFSGDIAITPVAFENAREMLRPVAGKRTH